MPEIKDLEEIAAINKELGIVPIKKAEEKPKEEKTEDIKKYISTQINASQKQTESLINEITQQLIKTFTTTKTKPKIDPTKIGYAVGWKIFKLSCAMIIGVYVLSQIFEILKLAF